MRTKSKPTRRIQASIEAPTGADSTGLISYYSNSTAYQSAVGGTPESQLSHCDFVSFLANAQCEGIDILPITWQPALGNVGEGGTAQINQSMINARLNFIFKRTNLSSLINPDSRRDLLTYHALISEICVLRSRVIRDHPNIVQLQGICWEVVPEPQTVRPVLVFEQAHFGNMKAYMESNLGQSLNLEERLRLIVALASALQIMHGRRVIHGDIKPANILMFRNATGEIVPKMADFGYSTIVHQNDDDEKIKLPRSRPWDAPEHTFGPCNFVAASRMDIFSLGMVCLWVLCHQKAGEETLLLPVPDNNAIDISTGWSWSRSIEHWKESDYLIRLAKSAVHSFENSTNNQRNRLDEFFTSALQITPADREHNVRRLLRILEEDPGSEPDLEGSSAPSDRQSWPTSAVHPLFQIKKLVLSLGGADCRVRLHMYRCLRQQALSSSCNECSRNAAYQLALCSRLGFCTKFDEQQSDQWLEKSQNSRSRLDSDIEEIMGTISSRPHHNPKISSLFDSGHLIPLDHASEYITFENLPSVRETYVSEIENARQGMGSHSPVVFSLRASLVSILFHENLLEEAETTEKELIAELEHDSRHGVDHVLLWNHHAMLGVIIFTQGRWVEAEAIQRKAVHNFTRLLGQDHISTLMAMTNLSLTKWSQGNVAEAERLQDTVVEYLGQALGGENTTTLTALNDMAAIFYRQCRYHESAALFRKVLASKEKFLGTKHPSTLTTMGNLALPLKHLGQLETAETLNRTALSARQHALGPKHSDVLTNMNNLAALLQIQGNYIEAKTLYQQVLDISTSTMGADHPDTLTSKNNLASVLQDQGLFHDALTIYVETLRAKEEHPGLGQNHTLTLDTLTNLGMVYEELGDYPKALDCHERVLRSRREADNGRVLVFSALQILGSLYQRLGSYDKAGECITESLSGLENTLGPENLATLGAVQALASLYSNIARSEEALLLYTRALRGREKILGAEHKYVLDTVDAMSELCYTIGNFQDAEKYARRALAGRETILGPLHPDSLISASNLSRALHGRITNAGGDHRDFTEASRLATRALSGMEEIMGQDHPDTLHMVWRMASLKLEQRNLHEAKELYQQAYEGLNKRLGPNHPDCGKCLMESKFRL